MKLYSSNTIESLFNQCNVNDASYLSGWNAALSEVLASECWELNDLLKPKETEPSDSDPSDTESLNFLYNEISNIVWDLFTASESRDWSREIGYLAGLIAGMRRRSHFDQ